MVSNFDMSELEEFEKELLQIANDVMPKETSKFLKKNARALSKKMKALAKSSGVKKISGDYLEKFKAGKVYKFNGDLSCRAYNSSKHAHLIENGHRQTSASGESYVPGKHIMESASKSFENQYFEEVENFIEDVLTKGMAR